jgi:hypothetical protein
MGTGGFVFGVKAACAFEAHRSLISRAEVKDEWTYISPPPDAFMARAGKYLPLPHDTESHRYK